ERTVSELIIATGTGEDQSAQKLGHYHTWKTTPLIRLRLLALETQACTASTDSVQCRGMGAP
ncbi:hypothetical protein PMR40_04895, partial [Bifidobacterium longum]|nr:hypothetical protein [Bifidobacterium longum]MDB6744064.1 hypothetical protein [Bifidobacterium longum]MDB6746058.1 hypothetical protein [Bifidobacterium longum]MDB6748360.1 hypothetical protein [Bifidobacterium longum]MDB6750269.1 hypothetical protein [Bifidobacterium longum]